MSVWQQLIEAYKKAEIEFQRLKPITIAQWILESGRGESGLAREHLNFGGLKYRPEMKDIAEPVDYIANDGKDTYCKFKSVEDFIKGYWIFIDRTPYTGWRSHAQTGMDFIRFIGGIYTPSKGYSERVISLLPEAEELLDLNIEFEPERLSRSDRMSLVDPPVITHVDRIHHTVRGRRPKGLEGMIVHFDAFRIRPAQGHSVEDRAIQVLVDGQTNKYCYGTISRSGRIYMPGNVDWLDWGYHAGTSRCPATGRQGISQYYIGWEINCPGVVYEDEVEDVFFAWFNTKVDKDRKPILRNGRRQIRSMVDEHYKRSEVRFCSKRDNIQEGWYVPYSRAQFDSLVSLVKYFLELYPDTFSIDKIFGHDEVAPGRKNDPGGALAFEDRIMTMPEFRGYLKQVL